MEVGQHMPTSRKVNNLRLLKWEVKMILKMKRRIQGVATDYSYYLIFTLFILEVYALLL